MYLKLRPQLMLGGAATPPRPCLGISPPVLQEVGSVWGESWKLLTPLLASLGAWGASWGRLGDLFGVLGAPWGGPGRGLGTSWKALEGLGRQKSKESKRSTFCLTPKCINNHEKSFPKAFWSSEGFLSMLLIALS